MTCSFPHPNSCPFPCVDVTAHSWQANSFKHTQVAFLKQEKSVELSMSVRGYRMRPTEMWKAICVSTTNVFTERFTTTLSPERNRLKITRGDFMSVIYVWGTLPEKSLCSKKKKKLFANRKFRVNPWGVKVWKYHPSSQTVLNLGFWYHQTTEVRNFDAGWD